MNTNLLPPKQTASRHQSICTYYNLFFCPYNLQLECLDLAPRKRVLEKPSELVLFIEYIVKNFCSILDKLFRCHVIKEV
jgi:hypothetical protein